MATENRSALLQQGALVGAAGALLVTVGTHLPQAWDAPLAVSVMLWALLVTLAEVSPVPLPRSAAQLTLTPAFDLSALFLFGPGVATVLAGLSRYAAGLLGRRPLRASTLSAAQAVVVLGLAGTLYLAMGGHVRPSFVASPTTVGPVVAALLTYAVLRAWLAAIESAVREGRSVPGFRWGDLKWELLHDLLLLPFGILLAWMQVRTGTPGIAYALLPVLIARYSYRVWDDTRRTHLATVRALMSTIDAFDPFTRGHSYRISRYALRLARQFGLPERQCEEVEYGALLHDIGRTAIHLDILQSPRPLDEHERAMLQTHPTIGYDIVKGLPFLSGAAEIVYAHHERPDGKGYPRGLHAEAIPMGARFIMVAAAFDAMIQDRPYRKGLPADVAYDELRRHAGTQFFPDVVETFIRLHQSGAMARELDKSDMRFYGQSRDGAALEDAAA